MFGTVGFPMVPLGLRAARTLERVHYNTVLLCDGHPISSIFRQITITGPTVNRPAPLIKRVRRELVGLSLDGNPARASAPRSTTADNPCSAPLQGGDPPTSGRGGACPRPMVSARIVPCQGCCSQTHLSRDSMSADAFDAEIAATVNAHGSSAGLLRNRGRYGSETVK